MSYIRFETACHGQHCQQPLGVFRAMSRAEFYAQLSDWSRRLLEDSLDWFNENLPVPQVDDPRGRAIFWFRPQSQVVREMWQLVAILRCEDIPICLRSTSVPGRIVYRDDHQIAAIPYGHGRGRRTRPHLTFDRHRWK
jgi:hypothetical protein